ncbi:SH3 domain-containing protein [Ancylobacter vacuolatus]|uniref:SH3-like domain-containing protein n=1 Tax=Ancylobacter vacuolatus TaxID=223389 RepID=A0ABU0DJF0_9HYPH|nr:SH3 domain-containing protein [Ancylobacter vacuolatus]MDQ0348547.1 SH3-like domain-containing protein [Ancylobacter vacuolatus]
MRKKGATALFVLATLFLSGGPVLAERALPYFATLRNGVTNVRVGPGVAYRVHWVFHQRGWPVEVVNRFGNWRRIRDNTGDVGWVHSALLTVRRAASIRTRDGHNVALRAAPDTEAAIRAYLAANVLVRPKSCTGGWCAVEVTGHGLDGFVQQARLWGVYPDENF